MKLAPESLQKLGQRLAEIPARIEELKKAGVKKLSRTDADKAALLLLRDKR